MTALSSDTINWALDHLVRHGDTNIFPRLFEFQSIAHCRDEFTKQLAKQDICQWSTRPFRKCLVPKHRYGFRIATQLDPLDMIFYLALSLEVGEQIEKARLPVGEQICYSHRFKPDNANFDVFDRSVGYPEFQERCAELSQQYAFVVTTDIADFYNRIYLHPLENALRSAAKMLSSHATAIIKLIKGWNQNVSHGIPVGSKPSNLLAELLIDDVDRTLRADGIVFARYVDDYRIFCKSREEAHLSLARLANFLYDMHGLTLQDQKTKILTAEQFRSEFLETDQRKELKALAKGFDDFISRLGLDNPYEPIEYDDLPPADKARVDGLNLDTLLEKQLALAEVDIPTTGFLLRRLGQLKRVRLVLIVLSQTDKLYPVFTDVIGYLASLTDSLEPDTMRQIGETLLTKLNRSIVSQLEYHRMLIMSLFAGSDKWGNSDKLPSFYGNAVDDWTRRTLLLALGKTGQDFFIRSKKTSLHQLTPWSKRALIYAASSLPSDEKEMWYKAIKPTLDGLERYVLTWASSTPINTK